MARNQPRVAAPKKRDPLSYEAIPDAYRQELRFHRAAPPWGTIRTAFETACTRAKVDDFRFHDLRHTCASWLTMRGRSLKEVQELLGHRTFAMTLR